MSWDLEIRSDDEYSQSTAFEHLRSFVTGLPKMVNSSFRDESQQLHMNIDLEFDPPDDRGMRLSAREVGKVNVVSLHIPTSKLHDDARDEEYFDLAAKIAMHLGWKVYDCQMDEYIA